MDSGNRSAADHMLTVPEAAARLGLSVATIRAWLARRKLGAVHLGRSVRIPESEITRMITRGFIPPR